MAQSDLLVDEVDVDLDMLGVTVMDGQRWMCEVGATKPNYQMCVAKHWYHAGGACLRRYSDCCSKQTRLGAAGSTELEVAGSRLSLLGGREEMHPAHPTGVSGRHLRRQC